MPYSAVQYINVGEGDSILIKFPDDKLMLIDTADIVSKNVNKIENIIKRYSKDKIDYLVLTHPDVDHVGNAQKIIEDFSIGTAYIPLILEPSLFTAFNDAVNVLNEKQVKTVISKYGDLIEGENYFVAFLSPLPVGMKDSAYGDFNGAIAPTGRQTDNLSPIIYVDIKGVRFLFTGDASSDQEEIVIDRFKTGVYSEMFGHYNKNVNLFNVDFLKVSNHGASSATCERFLETVSPDNAIISVGGTNYYGNPSSDVLMRIVENNEDCNILRTDAHGNIRILINEYGKYTTKLEY